MSGTNQYLTLGKKIEIFLTQHVSIRISAETASSNGPDVENYTDGPAALYKFTTRRIMQLWRKAAIEKKGSKARGVIGSMATEGGARQSSLLNTTAQQQIEPVGAGQTSAE